MVTRRAVLGGLMGSVAGAALANAPLTSVRPQPRSSEVVRRSARAVDDLMAEARLSGKIGFAVADARTGEVLEAKNPVLPLPPASVTKAITALYALDRLGPGYRFRTRLVADGVLANGRLKGDLILVGGGDPTLDTDALGEMARQLKAAGLREITGRFKVHSRALPTIPSIDPDQPAHVGYNPTISGLNLNYNRVHFEWKRQAGGYALKMDARARKYSPQVAIARMTVVNRRLPVYTYADKGGADQWTVAKPALGKAGSRWLPVRKPQMYAAEVFQTLARSHGIVLPRAEVARGAANGTVLVARTSAPLRDILRDMLKWSTNLTAEVVGLSASAAGGKAPTSLKASAAAMTRWAKGELGVNKAKFVDHSGLGGASRMSAADMVKALVRVRRAGLLPPILKDIPMRNAKGEVLPNHPVKIKAKTGTLNYVSALAGYMSAQGGRELAFAIFTADLDRRAQIDRAADEVPEGTRAWKSASRRLQLRLIERWGAAHTG
ncbi:MAG: D-alanyl-D-alanine carboxypeptidase/D-alanyl-D-alanine-endopeptidase [Rhodobacter sp.]|nr:D-alanyl-D-alanine carboxypeptidase/D-alanyl-D-alanine-endopeptidase [Rhodobacter sp.]